MIWKIIESSMTIIGWILAEKWELQHKRSLLAILGLTAVVWVMVWIIVK